jgi:LysM repeat protein
MEFYNARVDAIAGSCVGGVTVANKIQGPMCQLRHRPLRLADGTICRCESPLPGPDGQEPSISDNFGADKLATPYLGQERWFERRYPNLLEDARLNFVSSINHWIEFNWADKEYNETSRRIAVHGRNKYESKKNANIVWTNLRMRDDRFEQCGDLPQTFGESDDLVGSFAIDIETPVKITYLKKTVQGQTVETFEWTAVMYVEDVLGAQANDNLPGFVKSLAPSRKVKRGKWEIHGEGVKPPDYSARTHTVVPGDTLSLLAKKYYKDETLWPIIYRINRHILDTDLRKLRVGAVLDIPELSQIDPLLKEAAMRSAPSATGNSNTIPVAPPQ